MEKLTYDMLSDEDKLLMDGLFQHKVKKQEERKIIRNIMSRLRKREMDCTKDIMNLSQKAIGEKFDLGANSAKPLSKKNREKLLNKKSIDDVKAPGLKNEKKTCSQNRQQPRKYSRGITQNSLYIC